MIRATKEQLEEFKSSLIWQDICDELNELDRKATIEYSLVGERVTDDDGYTKIPTTAETLMHLGDIKGRKKAVQYFLDIVDVLINEKDMEEKDR